MKVENMTSSRGNKIANQFIIKDSIVRLDGNSMNVTKGNMFQSYQSNIAFIPCYECMGTVKAYLDSAKWDYSVTTSKYRNIFLSETKKETQTKIDSGEYKLVDLN